MSFMPGFQDELQKLAKMRTSTKAWALSRGITSGVAAALMGLGLMHATKGDRGKKKDEDRTALKAALVPGVVGTGVGLGKGTFERGLEHKIMKMLTKGRR